MTIEGKDILIQNGTEKLMVNKLLLGCISNLISSVHTKLSIEYVAKWKIENNMLWLVEVVGQIIYINNKSFSVGKYRMKLILKNTVVKEDEKQTLLKKLHMDCLEEKALSIFSIFNTNEIVLATWIKENIYISLDDKQNTILENDYEYKRMNVIEVKNANIIGQDIKHNITKKYIDNDKPWTKYWIKEYKNDPVFGLIRFKRLSCNYINLNIDEDLIDTVNEIDFTKIEQNRISFFVGSKIETLPNFSPEFFNGEKMVAILIKSLKAHSVVGLSICRIEKNDEKFNFNEVKFFKN